ncbi:MAG: FliH/SctL family protein [Pyrinomonadaceae bacterium]
MLAKVVKKNSTVNLTAFKLPELGGSENDRRDSGQFVFPQPLEFDNQNPPANQGFFEEKDEGHVPTEEEILGAARQEAEKIIAQAEKDREMIQQAAKEKGLQFAQKKIEEEVAAQVTEMRQRVTETIEKISGLQSEITAGAEKQLVELALEIAKKIVGREVTIDREIALTLVRVSLSRLQNRAVAKVHLHPDDFAFIQTHREKLDFHGSLELIEDRSVSVGGCLVHTETGDIDARIESQFEEIAHGLLGN